MFSLNLLNSVTKKICHYSKGARTCHPATSCLKDQDDTTVPARHMWETGSLNWVQFMFQWLIRFPEFAECSEFLFHLGKTPLPSEELQCKLIWCFLTGRPNRYCLWKTLVADKHLQTTLALTSMIPSIFDSLFFSRKSSQPALMSITGNFLC